MTASCVAVVTDVVIDGKPVIGYGFNSNGRYAQGGILRDRIIPRLTAAKPEDLLTDDGRVVGGSWTEGGDYHAFLWTLADGMQDLGAPPDMMTYATAIADNGHIVGGVQSYLGQSQAVLWGNEALRYSAKS